MVKKNNNTTKFLVIGIIIASIVLISLILIMYVIKVPYTATEQYTKKVPYIYNEEYKESEPYTTTEIYQEEGLLSTEYYLDVQKTSNRYSTNAKCMVAGSSSATYVSQLFIISNKNNISGCWKIDATVTKFGDLINTNDVFIYDSLETVDNLPCFLFLEKSEREGITDLCLKPKESSIYIYPSYIYSTSSSEKNYYDFNVEVKPVIIYTPELVEKTREITKYKTVSKTRVSTKYRDEIAKREIVVYDFLWNIWTGRAQLVFEE